MTAQLVCDRKRQYQRRRDAKRAASAIRKIFGRRMRPYRCRVCRLYHLSSQPLRR